MEIKKVVVIGSGTMGSGIAAHLCNADVPVTLLDLTTDISTKARDRKHKSRPPLLIDKSKILKKVSFTHPYFDQSSLNFQSQLTNLQNKRNILFCGSYFGYGFHEDGIKSSIEMLKTLND